MNVATVVAQAASPWAFHLHPDVLGLVVALLAGYGYAVRRWGRLFHPRPTERVVSAKQVALFVAGVAAFWAALGWPVHDLSENYLYSAHMLQHILLGYVAPPLLLLGMPRWLGEIVLGRGTRGRLYRLATRPIIAGVAFNVVLALIHWPLVVDLMVASEVMHAGFHLVFLVGAVLMWSVLYSPIAEVSERLQPPGKMLFLFAMTLLPTVPASFLTFGERPLYRVYETFPRLWGLSATDDMQLAGLLMKVGAGLLLWSILAVMFFRWASREEPANGRPRTADPAGSSPSPTPNRWS
ncbi:MAG: cytochrome c oxidase assembly protein [Nitriliruptorales bacterium]